MTLSARRPFGWALVSAALVLVAPHDGFAQIPPGGSEIIVSGPAGGQSPAIAFEPGGGFVMAWQTAGSIVARRFERSGIPRSAQLLVSQSEVATAIGTPVVAVHPGGGFLVAWQGLDGSGIGIRGRLFDAAGLPAGSEVVLNVSTAGSQTGPRVSAGPLGYVVVWVTAGASVEGRLFDPQLGPRTGDIGVSPGSAADVAVVSSDGVFVVAWLMADTQVKFRFFNPAGAPIGVVVTVAEPFWPDIIETPRIAAGPEPAFTVGYHVWYQMVIGGFAPMPIIVADRSTWVRRYDGAGAPLGGAVEANVYQAGWQENGALAVSPAGQLLTAWSSVPRFEGCSGPPSCWPPPPPPPAQDGDGAGVYARGYGAADGEFRVNVATAGDQLYPSVAASASGFAVAYQSNAAVAVRLFPGAIGAAAFEVDPTDEPTSDGNRVLENGETVMVAPAWRNLTGAAATVGSWASAFTGPGAPAYMIIDGAADYGAIPDGATRSCRDTGNCFLLAVSGARPAAHWDAQLTESASLPFLFAPRTRAVHIGDSFADVPRSSPFYRFVETAFHNDVMTPCGPAAFCPALPVTREWMSVLVLRALNRSLIPPPCVAGSERFTDVPASNMFCAWIEELARRGVVGGCGGGRYCPLSGVSRETMAVYLLLTQEGAGYVPPACGTPMFADVPASSPFCRWIEELARRQVVSGCGNGNYCPGPAVTREQMSVFLAVTFGLALYIP